MEALDRKKSPPKKSVVTQKQDPPNEYLDPITLGLMRDPVINQVGQTYERESIEEWYKKRRTDPVTSLKVPSKLLTPNLALKKLIIDYCDEAGVRIGQKKDATVTSFEAYLVEAQLGRQMIEWFVQDTGVRSVSQIECIKKNGTLEQLRKAGWHE